MSTPPEVSYSYWTCGFQRIAKATPGRHSARPHNTDESLLMTLKPRDQQRLLKQNKKSPPQKHDTQININKEPLPQHVKTTATNKQKMTGTRLKNNKSTVRDSTHDSLLMTPKPRDQVALTKTKQQQEITTKKQQQKHGTTHSPPKKQQQSNKS